VLAVKNAKNAAIFATGTKKDVDKNPTSDKISLNFKKSCIFAN